MKYLNDESVRADPFHDEYIFMRWKELFLVPDHKIKDIYGVGYEVDYNYICNLKNFRNKIFHGQLTGQELSRTELTEFVTIMKRWSKQIAESFQDEINYDGFERNSLKKSKKDFSSLLKYKITNIEDLEKLLIEMTSK